MADDKGVIYFDTLNGEALPDHLYTFHNDVGIVHTHVPDPAAPIFNNQPIYSGRPYTVKQYWGAPGIKAPANTTVADNILSGLPYSFTFTERVSIEKKALDDVVVTLKRVPCDDVACKNATASGRRECNRCAALRKIEEMELRPV